MIVIVLDGVDIVDRMKNIHTCDDSDKLLTHAWLVHSIKFVNF